ncbi:MAG: thioredoxin TrxC [Nitrospirota bacterium]
MTGKSVLLRCSRCGAVNRVPEDRLNENPKCGKCRSFLEFPRHPVDVTSGNFDKEVLHWPGAVLVEFWAPWCGYCRSLAPSIMEIAGERAGRLKVVRVNVEAEQSLGARFQIRATPTFVLYRNGVKLADVAGALPRDQLEAWIDSALLG